MRWGGSIRELRLLILLVPPFLFPLHIWAGLPFPNIENDVVLGILPAGFPAAPLLVGSLGLDVLTLTAAGVTSLLVLLAVIAATFWLILIALNWDIFIPRKKRTPGFGAFLFFVLTPINILILAFSFVPPASPKGAWFLALIVFWNLLLMIAIGYFLRVAERTESVMHLVAYRWLLLVWLMQFAFPTILLSGF